MNNEVGFVDRVKQKLQKIKESIVRSWRNFKTWCSEKYQAMKAKLSGSRRR